MNHVLKQRPSQAGFTLIELMLAMTFIAVLLLGIAMTIIQIGSIYNKGLTYKEVNVIGRDVSDDLRRNIMAAGSLAIATDYMENPAYGGRLCLGSYSYVWNYEKARASQTQPANTQLVTYTDNAAVPVRLVKVSDPGKAYCEKDMNGVLRQRNILAGAQAQELVKAGDRDLGLHSLTIRTDSAAVDMINNQQLYTLSFVIGTGKITAMDTTQTGCLPPGQPGADSLYCTVQPFSLVIRAGNGVN